MLAAIESILLTKLRGTDTATLFAPASHASANPLTRAMFRHQRQSPGAAFAQVAVEFQTRQLDSDEAFVVADAAARHTLLTSLNARLPDGAALGDLDDEGTVGVFLPGGNDPEAAIRALHTLLDEICGFSMLSKRRCLVARWRAAATIGPREGQSPVRLIRLMRERLPAAKWSSDQVAARQAAAEEAGQQKMAASTKAAGFVRAF